MSTGALAVVLGNTPNQFNGLQTCGKVVFVFDLVLFTLFNLCMFTRFILVPRKLLGSLHHPVRTPDVQITCETYTDFVHPRLG
jgi:tellurite resistance protein TehA-like permease